VTAGEASNQCSSDSTEAALVIHMKMIDETATQLVEHNSMIQNILDRNWRVLDDIECDQTCTSRQIPFAEFELDSSLL